jgi:hypothetical protein
MVIINGDYNLKTEGELIMHHAYNRNRGKEHMVPTLY